MIKAVAVDVDGTITDSRRRLCCSAMESLRSAEEKGIPVIIVTGNILPVTKTLSIFIGTSGGLVAENGGVIESPQGRKILGDITKCQRAYEFLKTKYTLKKVDFSQERVSEIAFYRTLPVELIKDALNDFDVKIYDTKFALHITDPAVDKGSALVRVSEDMSIRPEEVLAIGDSENDLEFLKVAGLKVAVANASPELKAQADYVTEKPYGDGVKEALERFLP
ncbi:MAG: phosphoglycolate phosphatase [Methanobacterium sp.]|uniref:phosphoglycolate phosphatase n=1 Tax=Methanobacterium sp. TaxID=2164 RepID=UPI0003C9312A|nr:phosphoglycolate phosphatase [Methanobacterium sp.]MDI3550488.1 phosphoglycolate phosphatase [Methanobacterium sp.]CDG64544.1 Phosphoglycolate phosphatase [Methanobacterium sp. MB1]